MKYNYSSNNIELMAKYSHLRAKGIECKKEDIDYNFDKMMCKGKQRRCDVCNRLYKWEYDLPPIDYIEMAINVEEQNKKLTCSIFCYLIAIGKFIRVLEINKSLRNLNVYYTHYCHSHDNPYFRLMLGDYVQTKEDQGHYQ